MARLMVLTMCLAVLTTTSLQAAELAKAESASPTEVELFNGKDLQNWTYVLQDPQVKMEDVWQVEEGILICRGKPPGYLRTKEDYRDYRLTVEWRWKPGTSGGNSGVLVHTSTPGQIGVWPKSLEVQLAAGNAGDFWVIGETIEIDNPQERVKKRRHLKLVDGAEKAAGEWNQVEIVCQGDNVTVVVNGQKVNEARKCSAQQGAICLQSEGAEVHFRKVKLEPLAKRQ